MYKLYSFYENNGKLLQCKAVFNDSDRMKQRFYLTQLLNNTPYLFGYFYYNNFFQLQVFLVDVYDFLSATDRLVKIRFQVKNILKRDLTIALMNIYLYLQYGIRTYLVKLYDGNMHFN